YEKEIHFRIRILQTSSPPRRPVMLCGNHDRAVGSAANALWTIRQLAADCAGPISRCAAGGEVRYLAAVARYETAACKGMHAARERRPRNYAAPGRARWSGRARPGCAASARQNWNTGTNHQLRWKQQHVRLCSARPQWSGRSQSRGDDVQPAFSNLRQERELALRSGSEQYALERIWWRLSDR